MVLFVMYYHFANQFCVCSCVYVQLGGEYFYMTATHSVTVE